MKKVTLFAAMAALVFASCNKDENLQFEMSNHTITASMETDSPGTRTAFDRTTGALNWIAGDGIAVLNTNGSFTQYTLTEGAGTANGKFEGTKIGNNSNYALHPYSASHKYENSQLTFNLPDSYTYNETQKGDEYGAAPMIACTDETDASNFYFEHLGGAFCFTINNLPAATTYFKFEADEQITGDFAVVANSETEKYEISIPTQQVSGESAISAYSVTINFSAEESVTNKKFFIPLPVGTVNGFSISLGTSEGETWNYISTASNTITRRKLLAMPEVTLNATVDGSVATAISTADQLKSALANGGQYILTSNIDLGLTTGTLTIESGKDVIIDLNGKTLTTSNSKNSPATDDITVNGKLSFTNGTIETSNTAFIVNGELTLKNLTINGKEAYTTVSCKTNAKVTAENVIATSAGTAFKVASGNMSLTGCTVSSSGANTTVSNSAGTLTINGGSYTNTNETKPSNAVYVIGITGDAETTINGAAVTVSSENQGAITALGNDSNKTKLDIEGGTYKAGYWHALYVGNATVTFTDATFEGGGSWSDIYVAKAATINGETYAENTSINSVSDSEGLKTAITNGGNVTLTKSIDLGITTGTLTNESGKEVIIDLNGKTLTTSNSKNSPATDDITVNGKLSFTNGKIETSNTAFLVKSGELTLKNLTIDGKEAYTIVSCKAGATVTAENVTATTAGTAFKVTGGTMSLTGCTVTASNGQYAAVTANQSATLTISGGSYTGTEYNGSSDDISYVIGVSSSTANINTIVSGGNGGVAVHGGTATFTGGSYSGVKACGLYVNGGKAIYNSNNCSFSGKEAAVAATNNGSVSQDGGTTTTTYADYTVIQSSNN